MILNNHLQKIVSQAILFSCLLLSGIAIAQTISPALKQEFLDAKNEVANAQKIPSLKYAPSELKDAQDSLQAADATNDPTKFSQKTRLARAQAQLAIAVTEQGIESERLAETSQLLAKAKEDVAQLTTSK
jgi:hypothetical protein